jgi:signal transduction histidine kinase
MRKIASSIRPHSNCCSAAIERLSGDSITDLLQPTNAAKCLKSLHRYNLLATLFESETAFDRITTLAARIFDVPIALVSLVNEGRAWFKSCDGFNIYEIRWDDSICSFAVLTDDIVVVPDTKDDPSFACKPFALTEPDTRFWASAPLITHDGFNIGNFCLVDSKPHQDLNAGQRATIADLAAMVVDELEQKHAEVEHAQLLLIERAARVAAEEANARKDEFISTLSHELRTPLNAMLGWSHLLREKKRDEATTTRALETIERNAGMQSQLLEDLLDVTRIEQGKIRLKLYPLELAPVIAVAINAVQPAADAKKIRLEVMLVPCPGIISADPDRLQQVVCNLLSNSIKFTPIGGRVEIRVACSESSAQFQVIDTGIGIKPELLPYIFDRFWQAEGTSNKTQTGLGLGLAIASDLVKLHGGTICAESSGEGQGATLTVKLPLMNVPR